MHSRATELFQLLRSTFAAQTIDELIVNRQSEELWLEFKQVATKPTDGKLHGDDRKNLARAISGFGNSLGGIILWGIECTDRSDVGDVASAKHAIANVTRFKSWLEAATSACSIPPHGGVEHHIVTAGESDTGFVVTYIPASTTAPLQPVIPGEVFPHCLIRVGSSFMPAPLGLLGSMFGMKPPNELNLKWLSIQMPRIIVPEGKETVETAFIAQIELALRNEGPGLAREIYANLFISPSPSISGSYVRSVLTSQYTANFKHESVILAGGSAHIYSGVSKDDYKLPPDFATPIFGILFRLFPPFDSEFFLKVSYGAHGTPTSIREIRHSAEEMCQIYDRVKSDKDTATAISSLIGPGV